MANFLLTGSRAPVTLELARNLARFGHKVVLADSLRCALATNSKAVHRSYGICDPRGNIESYGNALLDIVAAEKIDVLVPTCEEAIYVGFLLSKLKPHCKVFCSDFSLLKQLHSKIEVLKLADGLSIGIPRTIHLNANDHLPTESFQSFVVKPEFGRFGNRILFDPSKNKLLAYLEKEKQACLLQERVEGKEYCTYALVAEGKVMASVIYEPKYRIGHSASYFFMPVKNQAIERFVRQLSKKVKFTGHIGFDFIVRGNTPYLIECNPRATSGLHFLWQENLADSLLKNAAVDEDKNYQPAQITMAMCLLGFPRALRRLCLRQWWRDITLARGVIEEQGDNRFLFFTFKSIFELLSIALQKRISIRAAATQGIEWDGEDVK